MAIDSFVGDAMCPSPYAIERARAEGLERELAAAREALRFYAEREHLYGSLADDWDSCSDHEAAGWLWPSEPAEDESWGVEDGSVARAALAAAPAEPKEQA